MATEAATTADRTEDCKHQPPEKSDTTDVSDPTYDIMYTTRCEEEGYGVIYSCGRKNFEIGGEKGVEKKEVDVKEGCICKADGRGEC